MYFCRICFINKFYLVCYNLRMEHSMLNIGLFSVLEGGVKPLSDLAFRGLANIKLNINKEILLMNNEQDFFVFSSSQEG